MPSLHPSPPFAGKLPEDLIRLSVGIEDPSDLIHDISQAFELASNAHVANVRAVRRHSVTEAGAPSAAAAAASGASSSGSPAGGPGGLTVSVPAPSPTNSHLEPAVSLGCGTATAEDAALIARSEIARLQATVRVLKERIAEGEARAAAAEAARRLAVSGGASASAGGDGATGGTANGGSPGGASSFRLSASAAQPAAALPVTVVSAAVGALAAAVAVALLLGRRSS